VGDGDSGAGGVVDGHGHEVLDQRSTAPDIEHLRAEADGEDGLMQVVRVLQEELVDVFPGGVGGIGFGLGELAVLLRVDVGGRAGEQDGLAGGDEFGCRGGWVGERDFDGSAAGLGDRGGVLRPGLAIVFVVGGGGDRDGDAGRHRRLEA